MKNTAESSPVELLSVWDITEEGKFVHENGRELSRKDWEIEISYEFHNRPDVLLFAQVLSQQAENFANWD